MNDLEVLLAVRQRLVSLVFATTGTMTLEATATGFKRADAGSFLTDKFVSGMEMQPAGFADNTPIVIQSLTDTEIKTVVARSAEAPGANRSLTVGIPKQVSWENKAIPELLEKRWYLDEDYDPGVTWSERITKNAPFEHNPQWIGKLSGLSGSGVTALYTVARGILDAFPPFSVIGVMADGYRLTVSGMPAPSRGQLIPDDAGRAQIVIIIPLRKRSALS